MNHEVFTDGLIISINQVFFKYFAFFEYNILLVHNNATLKVFIFLVLILGFLKLKCKLFNNIFIDISTNNLFLKLQHIPKRILF
jgi:hypothetical protein